MAAGEYVIAPGVKVILDETTFGCHSYWGFGYEDEGYVSFRVQGDDDGCADFVCDVTAWLRERQEAFLAEWRTLFLESMAKGSEAGKGASRTGGVLRIPFYYCNECVEERQIDVELSEKDKVCPRCGEELDWNDIYGPPSLDP